MHASGTLPTHPCLHPFLHIISTLKPAAITVQFDFLGPPPALTTTTIPNQCHSPALGTTPVMPETSEPASVLQGRGQTTWLTLICPRDAIKVLGPRCHRRLWMCCYGVETANLPNPGK